MSDKENTTADASHEEAILVAVKKALTMVIKDTATAPGLKHPLTDDTIIYMRECLALISLREQELAEQTGRDLSARPRFTDEPQPQSGVVVGFDPNTMKNKEKEE